MYYLIQNNRVAGTSNAPMELRNFKVIEVKSLEASKERVYFDGETILPKPEQPSINHYWDYDKNEWVEANLLAYVNLKSTDPDWNKLYSNLKESPVWVKLEDAADTTIKASNRYTQLVNVLTVIKNESELESALLKMREALNASTKLNDLNASELKFINEKLAESNFNITLE